jgi:adenylate kinase family enzyme
VILGSSGAGKSALATAMAQRTGLPIVYLDLLFWRPGWAAAPQEQARQDLSAAFSGVRWIAEGNFLGADEGRSDPRFARADTVVFLDLPRLLCVWRVLSRRVRDRSRRRADLPEGCSEGFDFPLLRWIWGYPATERPRVLRLLARLPAGTQVHHLRGDAEVQRFLETLS